jgi:hypothetical protein
MTDAHGRWVDEPTRNVTGRDDRAHDSSAFGGPSTGGQSLADQPTEVVPPLRGYGSRDDTPAAGVWAAAPAPVAGRRPDERHDEGRHRTEATDEDPRGRTTPDYTAEPVAVRRADSLAGLLLVLAGIAAGVSLLLVWVRGGGTGLNQVRDGFGDLPRGSQWSTGSWQPLAVVLGGGVLFLLGLLMYVPTKTHRFLGVLALLVALAVGAGVLVPLADANWHVSGFDVGFWFTVAVGGLGLLGALKALSTGPRTSRS